MGILKKHHKEIRPFFEEQLALENLRREQQRSGLLAILFGVGLIFVLIFYWYISKANLPIMNTRTFKIMDIYLAGMCLYELALWNVIRRQCQQKKQLSTGIKFFNATMEVSSVTMVLYLMAPDYQAPILTMVSPFVFLYFYFIILSTLRLNPVISLYTGLIAGIEYMIVSLLLLEKPQTIDLFLTIPSVYIGKASIIMLCGVAAAFVGRQIQKSIETSIENLENQNQIITLFGQQVSPEVVQHMLERRGILESRHMKVAIMFLDIRNFTKFADKHTPDEIIDYQNAFFGIIVDIVNKHQGIVNQFLGDGCMITFGAPVSLENPAAYAVEAGLDILQEVKKAVSNNQLIPTRVGMGIHTGDVVTGNIGTERRQQYNITGNVVIQAARIEQLNKDFQSQLLVSKEVLEKLSKQIFAKHLGSVQLKGLEEEMSLYQLA